MWISPAHRKCSRSSRWSDTCGCRHDSTPLRSTGWTPLLARSSGPRRRDSLRERLEVKAQSRCRYELRDREPSIFCSQNTRAARINLKLKRGVRIPLVGHVTRPDRSRINVITPNASSDGGGGPKRHHRRLIKEPSTRSGEMIVCAMKQAVRMRCFGISSLSTAPASPCKDHKKC